MKTVGKEPSKGTQQATQQTNTCSSSTTETLRKSVKYVQSKPQGR